MFNRCIKKFTQLKCQWQTRVKFTIFGSSTNQIELENILKVINNAGTDDDLKAIYLDVDGLSAYFTSALKIADALYKARENGKEIIAY